MLNDKLGHVIHHGVTTELDFMEETLKYPYYRVDCASWKIVIEISNKSPISQNPKCYNFNPTSSKNYIWIASQDLIQGSPCNRQTEEW